MVSVRSGDVFLGFTDHVRTSTDVPGIIFLHIIQSIFLKKTHNGCHV